MDFTKTIISLALMAPESIAHSGLRDNNISHIGAAPKGLCFLRRYGLKMGIEFADFGLESGIVLEGTRVVQGCQ